MNKKNLVANLLLIYLFLYSVSISAALQTYSFTADQAITGNSLTGACTTNGIAIAPELADPVFSAWFSSSGSEPSPFTTEKCYTYLVGGVIGMGYAPVTDGKLMRLSATAPFNIQSIKVFPKTEIYVHVDITRAGHGSGDTHSIQRVDGRSDAAARRGRSRVRISRRGSRSRP